MAKPSIEPGAELDGITIDRTLDEQGNNKHIDRLVALRHWASPLKLDESRLTVHVLEAIDPASAILEFTAVNQVDHIVIGARQNSMMRTFLGSVSAKVATEAAEQEEKSGGKPKAIEA